MSIQSFHEYQPGAAIRSGDRAYVVEKKISYGKFGYTFSCHDDWGYSRLLQVVWPFSRSYESLRERWAQQATDLRQVQHPGLVYLFNALEHNGCLHLVQERFNDRLDRLIVSPAWDGNRSLKVVARPVLCALEHVHRNGYLHGNLHPHNVFSTFGFAQADSYTLSSASLKLGDLAINTLLGKVEVLNTKISRSLVPPEYLSPSECGPLDHRADIYQVGLLLLFVLKGCILHYSFEGISTGLPAKHAERLESDYGEIIARALQPRVMDRFQSALELWHALNGTQGYLESLTGSTEQNFQ